MLYMFQSIISVSNLTLKKMSLYFKELEKEKVISE